MKLLKLNIIVFFVFFRSLFGVGDQPGVNSYSLGSFPESSGFFGVEKAFVSPGLAISTAVRGITLGMYQLYQMPDFNYRYIECVPWVGKRTLFGFHLSQLGNDLYNETQMMVTSAYKINEKLIFGGIIHLYGQHIQKYNQNFLYGLSIDAVYLFSDHFTLQSQWKHAVLAGNTHQQDLNQGLQVNIIYQLDSQFGLNFGMYSWEGNKPGMALGIQYKLKNQFILMLSQDQVYHYTRLASQIKLKSFSLTYAVFLHPVLDATHSIGVGWLW